MKKFIAFFVIFIIALSLRTYRLGEQPPGLTWDEAALGYNAYSILKTGRDEFGVFMPIIFKSFGDYKPGTYVYLTVPSVAIFGLNEFAVRLPSALFGALGVVGVGLLVSLLFENFFLGLIAAVTLAFMPWHLYFSRGAWEVNVFVTLLIYAIYFSLKSLNNKKVSPLIAVFLFSATFFTYQAAKLLTPLVMLLIVILNWQETKKLVRGVAKKKLLLPVYFLFVVVVLVYLFQTATGEAGNRINRLSIFNYRPSPSQDLIKTDNNNLLSVALFHSQIDLTLRAIASRYLYHFSPELLFKQNGTLRESLYQTGFLYIFDAVWLLAGLYYLARYTSPKKQIAVFGLLFIAPLGASLTLSEYSAVRALFEVVPLSIIIASGYYWLITKHRLLGLLCSAIYIYIVVLGLDIYFNHSANFMAPGFNYGYKQAIERIKTYPSRQVYFTDVYGQPYIYYLFYTAYDPARYQKNNNFKSGGVDVGSVSRVDNIEFHQFSVDDVKTQKDTLFIGTNGNIPDSFDYKLPQIEYYDQISLPDNLTPVFRVIKTKP